MSRAPYNPVPQSGHRSGLRNLYKLRNHQETTIADLEQTLRHARRALERIKSEIWALEDKQK